MASKKQTAKIEAKAAQAALESRAVTWQRRNSIAQGEQAKLFEKFRDYFNILYSVKSSKNVAPWRSKIYIPILAGKAWDFIARLADVEPRFIATILDEWEVNEKGLPSFSQELIDRAERISQKMTYDWKNPFQQSSPRDRVFSTLVDTVATGTGIAKIVRSVETRNFKAHEQKGVEGGVDLDNEVVLTVTQGKNTFEPVNIFNVKFAPKTDELQKAPWIIIDGYSSLAELKQAGVYDEAALNSIDVNFRADSDPNAHYNYARNELLQTQDPLTIDPTVNLLRTHECYSRNDDGQVVIETYVEANGKADENWVLIGEVTDPYWHNLYPLKQFYIRRKPYSVWGESLFENNETLQYASNDVFNHYMDNLNISLDGMIMMDENSFVEDFVVAPGEILMYKNEQPKQFKFNEPNPQQLTLVMNEMQKAVEAATVSQYATGTPDSANDSTEGTATGITKIMEAAEDKMGFMRSNFKASMEGVGQMWLMNDQQFMDKSQTVPTETADGLKPVVVTPLDLQGIVNITIDDDSLNPVSKSARLEKKQKYLENLKALAVESQTQAELQGKPEMALVLDYHNLAKDLSFAYGEQGYSQFVKPALTEEELAEQAAAAAEAQPQDTPPIPSLSVSIAYKDVKSPEAKAALLLEALPNYEGDKQGLLMAERNAQEVVMAHDQTIDALKATPDLPDEPTAVPQVPAPIQNEETK